MNERIRELADKIWAEEYWTNPNTDKLLPAQLNKFAELLIRECAFVAQNKDDTNVDLRYGRGLAAGKILEHFGVTYEP